MKMEPWELELQDQIRDSKNIAGSEPPAQTPGPVSSEVPPPAPAPAPSDAPSPTDRGSSLVFFALLLILGAVTFFVYDHKTGGKARAWIASHFSSADQAERVEPRKKVEPEESRLREEFEKFVASNKSQLDALQSKVGSIRDKVMLMGLLLNENFNILKQDESKEEMVFFNSDWTLNKMPTHIDLSDEDREYLRKYVSK